MNDNIFKHYENKAAILEAVASKFPDQSKEYGTIRLAALALFFATVHQPAEFSKFLNSLERDLTSEEKEMIRIVTSQEQ